MCPLPRRRRHRCRRRVDDDPWRRAATTTPTITAAVAASLLLFLLLLDPSLADNAAVSSPSLPTALSRSARISSRSAFATTMATTKKTASRQWQRRSRPPLLPLPSPSFRGTVRAPAGLASGPASGSWLASGPVELEEGGRVDDERGGASDAPPAPVGSRRALGLLVLSTVPIAWGTYTPVVKYVYALEPAVPGFVFSAGYYAVAAASLALLSKILTGRQRGEGAAGAGLVKDDETESVSSSEAVRQGGRELGLYLFVGNGLQVIGLQTVPADRAAFLVQLTTVMVPLASALAAGTINAIPGRTWAACALAFAGVIVMGADDGGAATLAAWDGAGWEDVAAAVRLSNGDALIILAAMAYTLHVVRLGEYAPRTTPLRLASAKAGTEAVLSAALVAGLWCVGELSRAPSSSASAALEISGSSAARTIDALPYLQLPSFVLRLGGEVRDYFDVIFLGSSGVATSVGVEDGSFALAAAAVLWTGWITCAYTIYAQSFGQSRVNPTDANLVYTTQPLFSSAFAFVLLGETLGPSGGVGAALIGTALWLVAFSPSNDENDSSGKVEV